MTHELSRRRRQEKTKRFSGFFANLAKAAGWHLSGTDRNIVSVDLRMQRQFCLPRGLKVGVVGFCTYHALSGQYFRDGGEF
jgi:hypothetical protein